MGNASRVTGIQAQGIAAMKRPKDWKEALQAIERAWHNRRATAWQCISRAFVLGHNLGAKRQKQLCVEDAFTGVKEKDYRTAEIHLE